MGLFVRRGLLKLNLVELYFKNFSRGLIKNYITVHFIETLKKRAVNAFFLFSK